jgi:hypothetical protein
MPVERFLSVVHLFGLPVSGGDDSAPKAWHIPHAPRMVRLAGALLGMVLLAGTLALAPLFGLTQVTQPLFAFAGLLLGNVAVIALERCLPARGDSPSPIALFPLSFILVFAASSGVSLGVFGVLVLLVSCDLILHLAVQRQRALHLMELGMIAGASLVAALAGLVLAWPDGAACLLIGGVYLPVLLGLLIQSSMVMRAEQGQGDTLIVQGAFLKAALHGQPATLAVVDRAGMIETATTGHGMQCANISPLLAPGQCIADAVMVADRVPLFHAISEGIHTSRVTEGVLVRLREVMPAEGYKQPPRFFAHHVSIMPVEGLAGRVMLSLIPAPDEDAAEKPVAVHLSARAVHDFVSPFNAGLGFLEMLADPNLTPQDGAITRQYAAKAHEAVMRGYHNAILLARGIACADHQADGTPHTPPQPVGQVLRDAVQALARSDMAGNRLILATKGLDSYALRNPDAVRLAIQIMLRSGLHAAPAGESLILEARQDGGEGCHILLSLEKKGQWNWPQPDAFDASLDAIGANLCGGRYARHAQTGLILSLPGHALVPAKSNMPVPLPLGEETAPLVENQRATHQRRAS